MYQAKSGVKKFSPLVGGGGSPPKKVAQNELKHILVLEFLRYDHFLGGGGVRKVNGATSKQASIHTSGHHSDQISRSALRDGATNKKTITILKATLTFVPIKYCTYLLLQLSFAERRISDIPYNTEHKIKGYQ